MAKQHTIVLKRPDARFYGRGERAIMVDGIQWGRTHVSHHGANGNKITFRQQAGEIISERSGLDQSTKGRRFPVAVWTADGNTENRVIATIKDMIAKRRLVHPDIAERRNTAKRNRAREAREFAQAKEKVEFANRAREALTAILNEPVDMADLANTTVDHVVAAMRWAQSR